MKYLFFFLFPFWLPCSNLANASFLGEKIDKSESAFFPPLVAEKLKTYKSFPSFWWNFVIFESSDPHSELEFAQKLCLDLKGFTDLKQVECQQQITSYQNYLEDWVRDLPMRLSPPKNFSQDTLTSLSQLSLPIPPELFQLLRLDPLRSFEDLQEITSKKLARSFERHAGFLYDKKTRRYIIPIHPAIPPSESEKLQPLYESLSEKCRKSSSCKRIAMIGPHGSALENKARITLDLKSVSFVGILVFLFSCFSLFLLKRMRVALLFIPIGIATFLSVVLTILFFGKIHGLTLSFGVGIIGLTIDYGLHAAFNSYSPSLWRSNTLGFLTTLVCLAVMYFSELPLLKQLIFFSVCGFSLAYLFLHFSRRWLIERIKVEPFSIAFNSGAKRFSVVVLCLSGLLVGFMNIRPSFDLRQFDYQRNEQKTLVDWFYQKHFKTSPLFEIETAATPDLTAADQRKKWSEQNQIQIESVSHYLPSPEVSELHLNAWIQLQCGPRPLENQLTPTQRKLFRPFLDRVECNQLKGFVPMERNYAYLQHLHSPEGWLTLWLPKDKIETESIQSHFPNAHSLSDIVELFPKLLVNELRWMFQISILLILLFLYAYYRNLKYVLISIIPFFCGLGLNLWFFYLFKQPLSFMSLIAIVMVLGLSVDYSIIAIDAYFCKEGATGVQGRTTGLLFAALSTLLGFVPLIFCKHPVLFQLGQGLSLGILGTLIGTFWGIPQMMKLMRLPNHVA